MTKCTDVLLYFTIFRTRQNLRHHRTGHHSKLAWIYHIIRRCMNLSSCKKIHEKHGSWWKNKEWISHKNPYSERVGRLILIFGERSLFLGKLRRSQKTASPGHKNDFFHQNLFFFSGSHPRQLFFAKKRTHFGQV